MKCVGGPEKWVHIIKRLVYFGHVLKMAPSTDTHQVLFCVIPTNWRRPAGRPHQTWLATITNDLDQLGISMDDVHELAADCTLQRRLIHGAVHQFMVHAADHVLLKLNLNAQ